MNGVNYPAQAVRGLQNWATGTLRNNGQAFAQDAHTALMLAQKITRAQHFVLPDGGFVFQDGLRGLHGHKLRLPFPEITVSYFVPNSEELEPGQMYVPKRVIYAEEISGAQLRSLSVPNKDDEKHPINDSDVYILVFGVYYSERGANHGLNWMPIGAVWCLNPDWDNVSVHQGARLFAERDTPYQFLGRAIDFYPGIIKVVRAHGMERSILEDIGDEVCRLLEFCEALTCSNVTTTTIQRADELLNKKRLAKGKLPLYESKVLALKVPTTQEERIIIGDAHSERNSPRQHLRRGHIRRLSDERNIWVNACVVGRSEVGKIDKQYALRTNV